MNVFIVLCTGEDVNVEIRKQFANVGLLLLACQSP